MTFLPDIPNNHLVSPMLEACKAGMVSIVKLLIEEGNVPADCWFNYPVKYANQKNYSKLKDYLLSKGVKDEFFN